MKKWIVDNWLFVLICVLAYIAGWVTTVHASEPVEQPDARGLELTDRQLQIEHAIMHIITVGLPRFKIKPNLGNPLAKNRSMRLDLVLAIDEASTKWNDPPMLLMAMAYREGSFTMEGKGKLNEASTFQMVKAVARHVGQGMEPLCELRTYRGSAHCAAAWLSHHRETCGDLTGSFVKYATGKRCSPNTAHVIWVLRDRFAIARELEKVTGYLDMPDSLSFKDNSVMKGNS